MQIFDGNATSAGFITEQLSKSFSRHQFKIILPKKMLLASSATLLAFNVRASEKFQQNKAICEV